MKMQEIAKITGRQISVLLFPRRCPFCNGVLGFCVQCSDCEPELKRLHRQIFRLAQGDHCLDHLSGAASVFQYDGCVPSAILRMKNGGQAYYAKELGVYMAASIFGCTFRQRRGIITVSSAPALKQFDLVIPVPPSDKKRGYNLPDVLAQQIAWGLNIPCRCDVLNKIRKTEKQEGKTAFQRMQNVKDAYKAEKPFEVEGRRVLLVDDVITTGATLSNCAKALCAAGALEVFAVTLAETKNR